MRIAKAAIFGATGSTGRVIAQELLRRGIAVRVVSRSEANLSRDFRDAPVERHEADLSITESARRAAEGCDVIIHAVGLPLAQYSEHPALGRNTASAMRSTGAKCILISGFWSFWPLAELPLTEESPRDPVSRAGRARKEQEDILQDAGAAIALLPDFYGPDAPKSLPNDVIRAIVEGRRAIWPGSPDHAREAIYVPDIAKPIVELVMREEAYGRRWIIPGGGAVTPRDLALIAGQICRERARIGGAPGWLVNLAGLARRDMRSAADIYGLYANPIRFDGAKLRGLIGDQRPTPYADGVRATIDWMRRLIVPREEE